MTIISLIAAMSSNRVIGKNNALPWNIPEELQHFKKITLGKPIVMGRKTFDAIGRRLLPGRHTIVLTSSSELEPDGFSVAHNVDQALAVAGAVEEIMIIGGSAVFAEFLPLAQRIYLSIIPEQFDGDAFFPEIDMDIWQIVAEQHHPKFSVKILER